VLPPPALAFVQALSAAAGALHRDVPPLRCSERFCPSPWRTARDRRALASELYVHQRDGHNWHAKVRSPRRRSLSGVAPGTRTNGASWPLYPVAEAARRVRLKTATAATESSLNRCRPVLDLRFPRTNGCSNQKPFSLTPRTLALPAGASLLAEKGGLPTYRRKPD
jgi:hypothetical protein